MTHSGYFETDRSTTDDENLVGGCDLALILLERRHNLISKSAELGTHRRGLERAGSNDASLKRVS